MTILEHIKELRKRIIISLCAITCCGILAYILYAPIVTILFKPFELINSMNTENKLFVTTLFEGFLTKIKISAVAGIILSFPVHLYNFIRFVFPGLTSKEKKVIVIGLSVSFILILISFYYSYFKVIPLSVKFLMSTGFIPARVGMILNFEKNIFYILQFIFISLVVFQTPILLELLLIMNVFSRKALLKASRFVIVGIFVAAAILTPPDFISQLSLAVPLVVLYFLTILIAKIFRFGGG
ncbi:MAG: twin-arginine translocase subunit TatC [Spirochaetota bacterium]